MTVKKKSDIIDVPLQQYNPIFSRTNIKICAKCFYMIAHNDDNCKSFDVRSDPSRYDFLKLYNQKTTTKNIGLSDVSEKDKIWDNHRFQSELIENIYRLDADFTKYADRISGCSGILEFGWNDNGLHLKKAFFCRVRYCPVCQWRRSLLWKAMMYKSFDKLKDEYSRHRFLFVTLTVKNCHINDLRSTLKSMNDAFKKLTKRKEFGVVDGWIRTTEVTRDSERTNTHAHPHFHVLLMVKPSYFKGENYIKHEKWVALWRDVMRIDYDPVVDVRTIKSNKKYKKDDYQSAIRSAIAETLKYSIKPSEVLKGIDDSNSANAIASAKWFHELTRQTHRMRFVATGGLLKNALKPDDDITNEDLILAGEQQTDERRLCFTYRPTQHRYIYNPAYNK